MAAKSINSEMFQKMTAEDKPVLVDFWAPWCVHCRRLAPVYEKIAEQYQDVLHVVKVNIDEEEQLAGQEKIEVIPTLMLYRKNEAPVSLIAPESKAVIDTFLHEALEA